MEERETSVEQENLLKSHSEVEISSKYLRTRVISLVRDSELWLSLSWLELVYMDQSLQTSDDG